MLLLILLLLLPPSSTAEEVVYSIYSLPVFFGEKELIENGTLEYSIDQVAIAPGPVANVPSELKSISLNDPFAVSYLSIPENQAPNGFGLTLSKDRGGFSWEWFRRCGGVFDKLQGSGKVGALFIKREDGLFELSSVYVLEKITLRLDTLWWLPFWNGKTHQVEIEAGSTFLFAEPPNE